MKIKAKTGEKKIKQRDNVITAFVIHSLLSTYYQYLFENISHIMILLRGNKFYFSQICSVQ